MKNFSKEQIAVMVVSLLSVVVLASQVISIDTSGSVEEGKIRYRASIDSVRNSSNVHSFISEGEFNVTRDLFNFKVKEIKPLKVERAVDDTPVVRTRWVNTNEIELFGKDQISYSFFFNGKARFTIGGRTQEFSVGDELKIGKIIQREVIVGSGNPTGNTKAGNDYSGKILSIGERSVYVDTELPDNVVQYRPGADARFFARNLMQDPSAEDRESPSPPGDTPGRRPGRGR